MKEIGLIGKYMYIHIYIHTYTYIYLERKDIRYFGKPPVKFSKSEADNYKIKVKVR